MALWTPPTAMCTAAMAASLEAFGADTAVATAVGIPAEVAVPAVLLFRFLAFWLPILPGWVAFAWMQRTGKL